MGGLAGSLFTNKIENHIFSSNSEDLEAIGLHSFTLNSFYQKWNKNLKNINFILQKEYSTVDRGKTIFDVMKNIFITGRYLLFDAPTQTYSTIYRNYIGLIPYINYYENRINNPSETPVNPSMDLIINSIKKSGGVVFEFNRSLLSSYQPQSGEPTTIKVVLKFLDRQFNEKDVRNLGIRADINIVGQPRTEGGTEYVPDTEPVTSPDQGTVLRGPYEGGINNPKNTVAAPIDLRLDSSTGKWSAGTHRVLATLLTDIDPAPIPLLEIDEAVAKSARPSDFTGGSLNTTYIAPTGSAMVLKPQRGDRNLLTPTFIKKCGEGTPQDEAETLKVTNRFNKTFKKGTTVFLSQIGQEWIIEEQPQDPPNSDLKIKDWAFCKLIANSDHYFKTETFYNGGSPRTITPAVYEQAYTYRFYDRWIQNIVNIENYVNDYFPFTTINNETININSNRVTTDDLLISTDFIPSLGYYEDSVFDYIPYLNKTNTLLSESYGYADEVGIFWGPIYMDGYRSINFDANYASGQDYANLYREGNGIPVDTVVTVDGTRASPNNLFAWSTQLTVANATIAPSSSAYRPTINDIPAEMTSRIILWDNVKNTFGSNFNLSIPSNLYPKAPYYESSIASKNKIQFIPLTANFVAHNDDMAANKQIFDMNFKTNMKNYFNKHFPFIGVPPENLFRQMFIRTINSGGISPSIIKNKISNCNQYNDFPLSQKNMIAYDCYISREPTQAPVGTPRSMFDDGGKYMGANCVGIVCGKTTIQKNIGGNINFEVTSNFGQPSFKTASGGQTDLGIIVLGGIPIPFLNSTSAKNSAGIPQFGAKVDEIHSFGTTALFTRIFDHWPEHLTIFDPRYFAMLHFNDGTIFSIPTTETTTLPNLDPEQEDITVYVDRIGSLVDFKIPTWYDGNIIPIGTTISSYSRIAPQSRWRVNPIRRGVLRTPEKGFIYVKSTLGLTNNPGYIKIGRRIDPSTGQVNESYKFKGAKYINGKEYDIRNGAKIKIFTDNNGSIKSFLTVPGFEGEFTDNPFPFEVTLPMPATEDGIPISGGEQAILNITTGMVYGKKMVDLPPKEHVPLTRVSSSSKSGEDMVRNDTIQNTFGLERNDSGKYDIFVHFHNDITHTLFGTAIFASRSELQYINMILS